MKFLALFKGLVFGCLELIFRVVFVYIELFDWFIVFVDEVWFVLWFGGL